MLQGGPGWQDTGAQLLICDKVGYVPLDTQDANRFIQMIDRRYTKGAMIVTSYKRVSEWVRKQEKQSICMMRHLF